MIIDVLRCDELPSGIRFPISPSESESLFKDILPSSKLEVSLRYYANTADVLIAKDLWDEQRDTWRLVVVASEVQPVETVVQLLRSEGLEKLKEWFVQTHEQLHECPDDWIYCSFTIRYDKDNLIYLPKRSRRGDWRRPPAEWWKE